MSIENPQKQESLVEHIIKLGSKFCYIIKVLGSRTRCGKAEEIPVPEADIGWGFLGLYDEILEANVCVEIRNEKAFNVHGIDEGIFYL